MSFDSASAAVSGARIAVIGGGITGLAAAQRIVSQSDRIEVTVIEASHRLGGIIRTEEADGFLLELGPDSFITNKPAGVRLCQEIGFADQLISTESRFRRSLVLRNGTPLPVPEGFQLMVPLNLRALLSTPVLSWGGRLRLLAERFIPARPDNDDETLESFVVRRFGRQVFERLVQPLVGGIYTADPSRLSLKATLPRFLDMERAYGSVIRAARAQQRHEHSDAGASDDSATVSGARYGLFTTAAHGLGSLIAAVEKWLKTNGRVVFRTGCAVNEILPNPTALAPISRLQDGPGSENPRLQDGPGSDVNAGSHVDGTTGTHSGTTRRWTLKFNSLPSESFDAVIVALPACVATRLLKLPAMNALATALNEIEYASSAIVLSGHCLADFAHPLDAFGLVIPAIERRNVLAVSFSSRKFANRAPDGRVLLRTFVGGAMQPELLQRDDAELSAIVNEELRQIFGMSATPMFSEVVRYRNAMPQYHVGHLDRVARIESLQSAFCGLKLAGNAFHGVGIPDSIASGRRTADRIMTEISG